MNFRRSAGIIEDMQMNDATYEEMFQLGLSTALMIAAESPATELAQHLYVSGLLSGFAIALGEQIGDEPLRAALANVADFARDWRAHNNARAN
jgi:hypothetical protein